MKRFPLHPSNRYWLAVLIILFLPGINLPSYPKAGQTVTQSKNIQSAPANPGDLDPNFGNQGIVQADPGGAVAVQFDGKTIVAGSLNGDFALARYTMDGSIDASFGSNGRVVTDFNGRGDSANAVAIQPDGKILVAGSSDSAPAMARYNQDGSLDPSFGESGKVLRDPEGTGGMLGIAKVVFQPDGKIIAGGSALRYYYEDVALARFNPNGSLDASFGNLGTFILQVQDNTHLSDMLVEPDGHIVVVGAAAGKYRMTRPAYLARIDSDGKPVYVIIYDFPIDPEGFLLFNRFTGVVRQSNGKLVIAGYTGEGFSYHLALARFTTEGSLDASFGDQGNVILNFPTSTWGADIQIQTDSKLLVSGNIQNASGGTDFLLARFTPDGALDPTFGQGGFSQVDAGERDYEGSQVALLRDGRILLGGRSYTPGYTEQHYVLARLLNDAPALLPSIWFPMVGRP